MRLVFTTYVFGSYVRYIPYYVFGINHSYPEHDVKIFVDRIPGNAMMRTLNSMQCQVRKFNLRFDREYIRGGNGKILRWLIPYEELRDYDYAYIGDVDMLISRESPTLLDSHLKHMRDTGLPFSNGIRPDGGRMSGLHFINVKEYYRLMGGIINEYLQDNKKLNSDLSGCERNEHFLYNMIKKGINLNGTERSITEDGDKYYRPHHGLHIGLLRNRAKKCIESIPAYVNSYAMKRLMKAHPLPELKRL